MVGVFGQTSGQFGSSSSYVFGNTLDSSTNPSGPKSFGSAISPGFPTQSSVFGGTSTPYSNPSFMFGKASGSFGSSSVYRSNSNSGHSPFGPSSSGNTAFPSFQTQGSFFLESSAGVFGSPSSSPASSPSSLFGQTSGSLGSSLFTNSNSNPFALNRVGSSTSSGLPPQSSSCGGTSTGLFGRTSSSLMGFPSTFSFGITSTAVSTSSAALGPASSTSNNGFAFKPFGSTPALGSHTTGSNFGRTSTGFHVATGPANPFAPSSPAVSITTISGGLGSYAHNTGTKIASYSRTIVKEGESSCKLISISAMPVYGSKSHEELRWENYDLQSGGKRTSESNNSNALGSTFISQCPAVSTNTHTSISCTPCFAPSLTSGLQCTQTPVSNGSESSPSIFKQGPIGSLGSWMSSSSHSSQNPKPQTPIKISSNNLLMVIPNAPVNHSPSTTLGHKIFSVNAFALPAAAQIPSTGTSLDQTTPTQAASTIPTFSTGGNVGISVLPGLGQRSHSQPVDKATESIVAVKDPFGPEPAASHLPISHLDGPSSIQRGISSMPVLEKRTTVRISSFLTLRHSSLKPLRVHVRKYRPKNCGPKVAFFDLNEETCINQKVCHFPIPRENPRSVFCSCSELNHVTATKDEASPTNDTSLLLYKDDINQLMPKLQRSDYYTVPEIYELLKKESIEPGFCNHVKDFVVGRHGYGWVKFEGETDVRGLDLDTFIHFNGQEVIVYMNDEEKPPLGQGLNKSAEVTLLNIRCIDRKTGKEYSSRNMIDKFADKLREVAEVQGAEFVSFDQATGEWKFRVKHF